MHIKKQKNTPVFENHQPHLQPVDHPHGRINKINNWLKHHVRLVLAIIAIIGLVLSGTIYYLFSTVQYTDQPVASIKKKVIEKIYSPLTGVETSAENAKRPVTGVMIENSPEARPQSGLKDAGIVYESVAEGGITRFLALYQDAQPALIGPVRSVRAQFASWVAAYDAGLAHVGGSDIPLGKLRSGKIKDLDQFFNAGAYYRANNRAAPHNVYTTSEKLQILNNSKNYTSSKFTPWQRSKKEVPSVAPTAKSIEVPVSTGLFAVHYDWDQASNSYLRSEGGVAHNDREGGRITPKVVIAMQVPHDVIRDSNNYSYPNVIGSGKAWVFQNGVVAEVTWSKTSDNDSLVFKDVAGKVVEFERGQVWVSAIKTDKVPTWL